MSRDTTKEQKINVLLHGRERAACSQLGPQTGSDNVENLCSSAVQKARKHPEDMKPVVMCPAGGATPLVAKRIPIICKPMGKMMTCEQLPDAFMVSSFTFSPHGMFCKCSHFPLPQSVQFNIWKQPPYIRTPLSGAVLKV